jgi:poly(3-hydroxybutyrate) depolymerase
MKSVMKISKPCGLLLLAAFLFLSSSAQAAVDITKELIESNGKTRVYYLFVPKKLSASKPVPLIVLLHGSGRNGNSLVEKWKNLAAKEEIILAGPDSSNSAGWAVPVDGPGFLHDVVEALKAKYPINARRVYLFGHSAGAGHAIYMSLFESQYFAATAIHAGALAEKNFSLIDRAKRKIPLAIWVGTDDQYFPLKIVRATRDAMNERGFNVQLTEISGHTHWYYDRASEINKEVWGFLKKHELMEDPQYEELNFSR